MMQSPIHQLPLSSESQQLMSAITTYRTLSNGEVLMDEGAFCNQIYYVESGCLKTSFNKDGKQINLDFAFENSFTTDITSLRNGFKSAYRIEAYGKTKVWEWPKEGLMELYGHSHEIAEFGRNVLEQLLTKQQMQSDLFKIMNPIERYEHLLATNPELLQKISLTQIASYLGMSRETLSRIRRKIIA